MDPLSQGVVGAAFAQSFSKKKEIRKAFAIGFGAGLLADMDILIRSSSDPLLKIEYHRHFTHSLFFIPVGGLLAAFILWPFFKKKTTFKRLFTLSSIGYGTHALLDACTSYGTLLLWPFSNERLTWSLISIIDPIMTFSVLTLTLCAFFKNKQMYARGAVVFLLLYLSLGLYQKNRVVNHMQKIAEKRGHTPSEFLVKPTIGNLILWKNIYLHNEYYHVDALRLGFSHRLFEGKKIKKLDVEKKYTDLKKDSRLYKDIQRFHHFSQGYLVEHPHNKHLIVDLRYTLLPHKQDFLWGIVVDPDQPHRHVRYKYFSPYTREKRDEFFKMLRMSFSSRQ